MVLTNEMAGSDGDIFPAMFRRAGLGKLIGKRSWGGVVGITNRGNLIAVVTNGTAVLGLGNIGALAAKPVMEGKSVLFKRFADIDGIDIEVDSEDVATVVNCVRAIGKSFGGINLEDIKAPECFEIERRLKERMSIPVFHDDQHGTAIVVAAGIINGMGSTGAILQGVVTATVSAASSRAVMVSTIKPSTPSLHRASACSRQASCSASALSVPRGSRNAPQGPRSPRT